MEVGEKLNCLLVLWSNPWVSKQELMRSLREIYLWGWTLCWITDVNQSTRCWWGGGLRPGRTSSSLLNVFWHFSQWAGIWGGAAMLWLHILRSWRMIHQQGAEESLRSCYLLTGDLCHSALVSAIAPPCQIQCVIIWGEVRLSTISTSALDGSCGYHSVTSACWKLSVDSWSTAGFEFQPPCWVCVGHACCNSPAVVIPLR